MPLNLTLIFPFLASLVLIWLPEKLRFKFAIAVVTMLFLFNGFLAQAACKYQMFSFDKHFSKALSISFSADGFSIFMGLFLWLIAFLLIACIGFTKDQKPALNYAGIMLSCALTQAVFFSSDVLLLFIFTALQVLSLANYNRRLNRGLIISLIGLGLFLVATVFIYINFSSLRLESLRGALINNWLAFLLLGSALFLPWQSISAAIKDSLSKSGLRVMLALSLSLYLFIRLLCLLFISSRLFLDILLILAVFIILLGAFFAIAQNSLKKILIFSVLSQAGFLILSFCQPNITSFRVSLLYLFSQGLGLSGLFLCAALIEQSIGSDKINDASGLLKAMPYTGVGFLLCAFSIIAIPPFLGFWPKLLTTLSSVQEGHIAIEVFAIFGAFLTLFYLMRAFNKVFLGELKINIAQEKKSPLLWLALGLGVLSLFLGFAVKLPFNFIEALIR